VAPGLTPEMVAAVSKLMRLQDLISVASKREVVTTFRSTIGLKGRLATLNQANHPTDDAYGIAASAIDGLLMGSGDAVIGANPAADTVDDHIRIASAGRIAQPPVDPDANLPLGHVNAPCTRGGPCSVMRRGVLPLAAGRPNQVTAMPQAPNPALAAS